MIPFHYGSVVTRGGFEPPPPRLKTGCPGAARRTRRNRLEPMPGLAPGSPPYEGGASLPTLRGQERVFRPRSPRRSGAAEPEGALGEVGAPPAGTNNERQLERWSPRRESNPALRLTGAVRRRLRIVGMARRRAPSRWRWRESNPRPQPCHGCALPLSYIPSRTRPVRRAVEPAGLEPAVSGLRHRRPPRWATIPRERSPRGARGPLGKNRTSVSRVSDGRLHHWTTSGWRRVRESNPSHSVDSGAGTPASSRGSVGRAVRGLQPLRPRGGSSRDRTCTFRASTGRAHQMRFRAVAATGVAARRGGAESNRNNPG